MLAPLRSRPPLAQTANTRTGVTASIRRLEGKVAVITGAASGMGCTTAARFAGEGANVVIPDLNADGAESAIGKCKENGGNAVFQLTDVTSETVIKGAIARAASAYGQARHHLQQRRAGRRIGNTRRNYRRKIGFAPSRFCCDRSSLASNIRFRKCCKAGGAQSSQPLLSWACAAARVGCPTACQGQSRPPHQMRGD
jgi:hypothetical protein